MGIWTESFGMAHGFKRFMVFGVLFFASGFVSSIALLILPSFNQYAASRLLWSVCAAAYAVFAALCVSAVRMADDTVEVSERGVAARRRHKPDIEMAWEEIAVVDDFLQARCLKLRSADGRVIRIEFQFDNFAGLLHLLERNLPSLGNSSVCNVFGKHTSFYTAHLLILVFFGGFAARACVLGFFGGAILFLFALPSLKALLLDAVNVEVHPDRMCLRSLLHRREIEFADIGGIQLALAPQLLTLSITGRKPAKELKLTGFKQIFHLSQQIRNRHERLFDE